SWATKDSSGNMQVLAWDFTHTLPKDSINNQQYYIQDLPAKAKGDLKIDIKNAPEGKYSLEVYKVGYRVNDAYSSYLSMGKPAQLNRQQVEQIKKQNDGSAVFIETITIKNDGVFAKELPLRENDVYFVNLIKL